MTIKRQSSMWRKATRLLKWSTVSYRKQEVLNAKLVYSNFTVYNPHSVLLNRRLPQICQKKNSLTTPTIILVLEWVLHSVELKQESTIFKIYIPLNIPQTLRLVAFLLNYSDYIIYTRLITLFLGSMSNDSTRNFLRLDWIVIWSISCFVRAIPNPLNL
jgi:hypothetical protein